jgi:hypothetical protein
VSRLIGRDAIRNLTRTSTVAISNAKWTHFAWMYSNKTQKSLIAIDGIRQPSIDFPPASLHLQSKCALLRIVGIEPIVLDVSSWMLFHRTFRGRITRLDIWKEVISEEQLLGSYRDCRKQNGSVYSCSNVSEQMSIDISRLKSSWFCSGSAVTLLHLSTR